MPDIHNKIAIADRIVQHEPADLVIYLGDYFDDFGDGPEDARAVAEWLNREALRDDRICIIGNHDVPYLFPATLRHTMCSGWSRAKADAIRATLDPSVPSRMHLFYADGPVFSHAGISNRMCENWYEAISDLVSAEQALKQEGAFSRWLGAGASYSRCGSQPVGGVTWCDWRDEFEPVENVRQVVGHTPRREPEWKNDNLCLDTHLRHYAVMEGDVITVHEIH